MTSHRYKDVDQGWAWLVMVANFIGVSIYCCTMYMGGVFYIALLDKYGEGKAKTSLVGALSTGFLCFFGPVASISINKIGCRPTLMIGGLIITTGNVLSAFVTSLDALIVTAGAMTGIGYALSCAALIVSLGYYFQKRRSQIISLSFVMVGAGLFSSAPISLHALEEYGLSGSFLILGCLNAQLCVIAMICRPSSIEKELQASRAGAIEKEKGTSGSFFNVALLKNKSFLCFLISTASWNFALNVGIMHLPNYISVKTSSDTQIGIIMTIYSVSNTIGRLLGSLTVGESGIDSLLLHIGVLGICGIVTTLFPLYSSFSIGHYVFAVQLGLYVGVPNVLMTALCIKMVGIEFLSEANGFSYFFCGIGVSAGPVVAGYVFGVTDSYDFSFLISGVVLLIGSLFGMAAAVLHDKNGERMTGTTGAEEMETFVAEPQLKSRTDELKKDFLYSSTGSLILLK